jgi:hypothetical protein
MKVKKASSKLVAIAVAFALIAGSGTGSVAALEKGPRASPEQVQAMETWTYTLAVQAATYGAPLVAMYNLRSSVAFGAKQYTLTLKPPMAYAQPVPPGFWSVTMYDKNTSYTVDNPINRYHLADYDALKKNADGSITLYLQTTSPGADKESNWLPAPPGVMPVGGK